MNLTRAQDSLGPNYFEHQGWGLHPVQKVTFKVTHVVGQSRCRASWDRHYVTHSDQNIPHPPHFNETFQFTKSHMFKVPNLLNYLMGPVSFSYF